VDDDRPTSKEEWLALDAKRRLLKTLDHLRNDHNYCIWCGAQYRNQEEMATECPGEAEEDHS